jgi:hypothetical protein
MQGYGLPADIKAVGYGVYGKWLVGHHVNDLAAGGVGYGLEYVSSYYHYMQGYACKYMGKYLLAQIFFVRGCEGAAIGVVVSGGWRINLRWA